MKKPLAPKPLERAVQQGVVRLFRSCGGIVYSTSQGYRRDPGGTRMTPGLSDLIVFFPRERSLLFFEVKRPGGVMTEAQMHFALQVHGLALTQVAHRWGGMNSALDQMREWGLIKGESGRHDLSD